MAKFRCNLSGNIFTFINDFDVSDMREHPQYTEVEEVEEEEEIVEEKKPVKKATKKDK